MNKVKKFWQRGMRGYSDEDVWSIYEFLLEVLPPMLKQMRERSNGYPCTFKSSDEWLDYIEKIEKLLRKAKKDVLLGAFTSEGKWDSVAYNKREFEKQEAAKEAFEMIGKHFFSFWD